MESSLKPVFDKAVGLNNLKEKNIAHGGNLHLREVLLQASLFLFKNQGLTEYQQSIREFNLAPAKVRAKVVSSWCRRINPAITENGIRALLLCLYFESSLNTTRFTHYLGAFNEVSGPKPTTTLWKDVAFGLAQWNQMRLQGFVKFMLTVRPNSTLDDLFSPYYQVMWMFDELRANRNYRPSLEALQSYVPVKSILTTFIHNYEGIPETGKQAWQAKIDERMANMNVLEGGFA